ncbi:Ficolin-1 [Lamellibrachia satsuma]|nr:Ficolin-1 [Lamellibrachia satsuma]
MWVTTERRVPRRRRIAADAEDAGLSFVTPRPSATDCADLKREGYSLSGIYDIRLVAANKTIKVYCDMTTDGGGWLVFQRRQDGSVDFYRDWASYKEGFGDVSGEFWLGNDYLHAVTAQKQYTLRIDLGDFEGATRYAVYSNFAVSDELQKYRLSFGAYNGTAGNALARQAGGFSTKDRDNDVHHQHCAQRYKGAWWYKGCLHSNLNAQYLDGAHTTFASGVNWHQWHGLTYSLKKVEMKLRP